MNIPALLDITKAHPRRVQAPTHYYPQLDGLRAIAVLLVLLCHFDVRHFSFGWIGVDAFFVLSGFLITKILLNCKPGPRGFGLFILRRILRTWPLYFALLLFAFVFLRHTPSGELVPWPRYIVFLQNFGGGNLATLAPTWSLCVEEHFYLVWPFLVFLLPRRALLPTLAIMFAALPLLRIWGWHDGLSGHLYTETPFHLDGLIAGACVALLLKWHAVRPRACRWTSIALFVLGAATAIIGFGRHWSVDWMARTGHNIVFGFTSLAVMFAGLLWLLLHEESSLMVKFFALRPMRYIGRISYGMYLLHEGVGAAVDRFPLDRFGAWTNSPLFSVPLRIAAVIGVAAISYRFFESPILRLKDRLK